MTTGKRRLDPELVKRLMAAAAAAKENVLNKKSMEALLNAKPEDLISADSEAEIIKGRARQSGCWIHSPANVSLFAAAEKRLTQVAIWGGKDVKRVEKVYARLLPGTKLIIITPAPLEDLTAYPVNRHGSQTTFNLIDLLGEHGLTVETGYRERYDVAYVPKESALWPALVIDLGQVKERRLLPTTRKEAGDQPPEIPPVVRQPRIRRKKAEAEPNPGPIEQTP